MELTKARKADVLERVARSSLSPSDFEWRPFQRMIDDYYSGQLKTITGAEFHHRLTEFSFRFVDQNGWSGCSWVPPNSQNETSVSVDTWPKQLDVFEEWLSLVNDEIAAPDRLAQLMAEQAVFQGGVTGAEPNAPFTKVERQAIDRKLDQVLALVRSQDVTDTQKNEVIKRLDYLREAADRAPRTDWRNIVLGQLMSIIFDQLLPPATVSTLWRLIVGSLRNASRLLPGA